MAGKLDGDKDRGGDRRQLDTDEPTRVGLRLWIAIAIVLAFIALAVWHHAG